MNVSLRAYLYNVGIDFWYGMMHVIDLFIAGKLNFPFGGREEFFPKFLINFWVTTPRTSDLQWILQYEILITLSYFTKKLQYYVTQFPPRKYNKQIKATSKILFRDKQTIVCRTYRLIFHGTRTNFESEIFYTQQRHVPRSEKMGNFVLELQFVSRNINFCAVHRLTFCTVCAYFGSLVVLNKRRAGDGECVMAIEVWKGNFSRGRACFLWSLIFHWLFAQYYKLMFCTIRTCIESPILFYKRHAGMGKYIMAKENGTRKFIIGFVSMNIAFRSFSVYHIDWLLSRGWNFFSP